MIDQEAALTDQELLTIHRAARVACLKARAAGDMQTYFKLGEEVSRLNAVVQLRLIERAA